MKDASELVIFFFIVWIVAILLAVFGYFWAKDKDALAGAFLMLAVMSSVLWLKVKNAKL